MSDYHHGVRVIERDEGTRPIRTIETGVIGIVGTAPDADADEFPLDTPVLIAGSRIKAAKLGSSGTLPNSMDAIFKQISPLIVVVRVQHSDDPNEMMGNVVGEVTSEGKYTGLQALLVAKSASLPKPRILGAPYFSHEQPVADALGQIAGKLRGFAYADAPIGIAENAITYRNTFGNKRLMILFPAWKVFDTNTDQYIHQPASAAALGLRAKLDNDIGWHKTLSNVAVSGVAGLSQDIDWDLQDPSTMAGYLNQNEVTTLINSDGFRFWGSRTCSGDPKHAFESAVRTDDILKDTIADAHAWAVDKPMSRTLFTDIIEGVNAKFRELKAHGYIVNAEAWMDAELNPKESFEAGKAWFSYKFTPIPPLEQPGFYSTLTNEYLVELLPNN